MEKQPRLGALPLGNVGNAPCSAGLSSGERDDAFEATALAPPVDGEIGVETENATRPEHIGQMNQARVSEIHWDIAIPGQRLRNSFAAASCDSARTTM